ncbi:MAG: multicopper oxidase domain-containing protein [Gammaproteobacteria bacterium]
MIKCFRNTALIKAVALCGVWVLLPVPVAADGTRHYYLAAEEVTWDYAPSGQDRTHGGPIPEPWAGHTVWPKVRYIEYTDASFSRPKPQPRWLGVLGPILRAEVGGTVVVHFLNRTTKPYSLHPHGLRYDKDNEGAHYLHAGAGAAVPPGERFTYTWLADRGSGPLRGEPSSKVSWYHSHVHHSDDIYRGLLGPIIVTRRGWARPDGYPKDVDREFVAAFMIFNEAQGDEKGLMHSINGYVFGNLPGLVMRRGEKVRWHLLGMGNEVDLHTPHWHGRTLRFRGQYNDVIELLPGSMVTGEMRADNPGTWLLHCHVTDHIAAGMQALYTVE